MFVILTSTLVISPGTAAPQAATITVETTADELDLVTLNGFCSLREALYSVNRSDYAYDCVPVGSGDISIIIPTGVYTLTLTGANDDFGLTGDLDIITSVFISGEGPDNTIIDGYEADRVFDIMAGASASVSIIYLTIRNGFTDGDSGGGIRNNANLDMNSVDVLSNRTTSNGGGIYNASSNGVPWSPPQSDAPESVLATPTLTTLINCTIAENAADDSGGGIYNGKDSALTIEQSIIDNNQADADVEFLGDGGGIYNNSAEHLQIMDSIISNNQTLHGWGGGLSSQYDDGGDDVLISGTVFTNNQAPYHTGGNIQHGLSDGVLEVYQSTIEWGVATAGGGIYAFESNNYCENVTFSHNSAVNGSQLGGAIHLYSASLELFHTTVVDNTGDYGAGIYNYGTLMMKSTIIAGNRSTAGGLSNCYHDSAFTSAGFNLSDGSDCALSSVVHDQFPVDPRLGSYGTHGSGSDTYSYALQHGSPAIDSADPVFYPPVDQRGVARPFPSGGVSDIGAFESNVSWWFLPLICR